MKTGDNRVSGATLGYKVGLIKIICITKITVNIDFIQTRDKH
jgi:hypothetical protein